MSKRFINLTTALILAAGSLSGAAPLLFSQTANAAGSCGGSYNVCINEFETDDGLGGSWVEIYNPNNTDLTGYQVYNSGGANTTIVAAEDPTDTYVTVPFGTNLSKSGDEILLKDGATTIDSVTYGNVGGDEITAPAQGDSAGRAFDGYSQWQIFTSPSKDATNNHHGPLVTNVTYNDGSGTKPLTAGTVLSGTVTISADAYSPYGINLSSSQLQFTDGTSDSSQPLDYSPATDATVSGDTYSWTIDTTGLSDQSDIKAVDPLFWDNSLLRHTAHFIALTVYNNFNPVINSGGGGTTATYGVPENQTAVTTVTATDANNDTLTYSITGGADASLFTIGSSSGKLAFKAGHSVANPADDDGDNKYHVTVSVSDGHGGSDSQDITADVGVDTTPPVISDAQFMLGNSAPSQTLTDGVSLTGHVFFSFKLSDAGGIATDPGYEPIIMITDNSVGHIVNVALNGDTYTGQYFTSPVPPIYPGLPESDNVTIAIYATDTSGNDASKTFTVRIDHTAPAAPTLVSPKNKAAITNNPPQLKWSILSNSDATHFKVQLSQDPNFVNGVNGETTNSLSYQPSGQVSDGTWYWRVRACDAATNCSAWSEAHFTIGSSNNNGGTSGSNNSGSQSSKGSSQNSGSINTASANGNTNSSATSSSSSSSSSNTSRQSSSASSNSSQNSKNNKPDVKLETPAKKTNKANNGGFNANWLWLLLLLIPLAWLASKRAAGGSSKS